MMMLQSVPRKGLRNFGSAVCVQRDSVHIYVESLSGDLVDPNPFRGTHSRHLFINGSLFLFIYQSFIFRIVLVFGDR